VALRAVAPDVVWQLIGEERVTHYKGAPTVQLMIINNPKAHRLERPVTAMVAASPPSPTLLVRMEDPHCSFHEQAEVSRRLLRGAQAAAFRRIQQRSRRPVFVR
jgi:hypothetical protein